MKTCTTCHVEKPETEFHTKRGKPMPTCKPCRSIYMKGHYLANREREMKLRKAWYEKNKLKVSIEGKKQRRADPEKYGLGRRLKKYGVTKEWYLNKLAEQNNCCSICKKPFTESAYIDHCHDTLITRDLLCSQCNTGFGLLQEDVAIFESCIAYAKKYQK
jgi:hypothetical protein